MSKIKIRSVRRIVISFFMIIMLFVIVQTPGPVAASSSTFHEDFHTTTYLDESATTVTGWGSEVIRIPFKTATSVGNASDTTYCSYEPVIAGDYLFLPAGAEGVGVVDITNPSNPSYVTTLSSNARAIAVQGDFAYISAATAGLRILNISDIENPIEVAVYNPGDVRHFTCDGSYGYLSTFGDGIHVLNISNPLFPISICNYTHPNATSVFQTKKVGDFLVVGEYGAPADEYGIQIVNATDPENLLYWSRITTLTGYLSVQFDVSGDYIYVSHGGYVSIIKKLTSNWNLGYVNLIEVGGMGICGRMAVSGNYIYGVVSGSGIRMIDVTDPSDPRIDVIKTEGALYWIAVDGNYVYTNGRISADSVEVYELSDALTATAQSTPVYEITTAAMITEATLTANSTIPGSTSIVYYLSADNGSTWELVTPGVSHEFGEIGPELFWKAVLTTATATVTPEIYSIDISFKFLRTPPELVHISYVAGYNSPFFEFDLDDSLVIIQLDTVQTFDSPNFRNYTAAVTSGVVSGFGVLVRSPNLANGTWYYRIAGVDTDGDVGLWSDTFTLQIGTATTTTTTTTDLIPPDTIIILVIGGTIGVIAILALVILRRKGA